jgi:hypothetical protein
VWNPSWALARRPDGTCMVNVKRNQIVEEILSRNLPLVMV